jgi:hypothetical protein
VLGLRWKQIDLTRRISARPCAESIGNRHDAHAGEEGQG